MPRCTARASGSLCGRKKYVPVPGATNGLMPSPYALRWIDTKALTFARRAMIGRSPSATAESVVRVMTTRRAALLEELLEPRSRPGAWPVGSQRPVGPVAPMGGWPGSTAMVRPASGRRSLMAGRPRSAQHERAVLPQDEVAVGCRRAGCTVTRARSSVSCFHSTVRIMRVGGGVVDDVGVAAHAVQRERRWRDRVSSTKYGARWPIGNDRRPHRARAPRTFMLDITRRGALDRVRRARRASAEST